MNVVISQPMFFPWVGMLEQVRVADKHVNYGDVQFSKGSFTNRVQIKSARGVRWMTVPLRSVSLGQTIDETKIDMAQNWQKQHLSMLKEAYTSAPYFADVLGLVHSAHEEGLQTIGALSSFSLKLCCDYFGLSASTSFVDVRELKIPGSGSTRVLDIVKALGGDVYVTGLGAMRYLDHQLFENAAVRVEYMNYKKIPYAQLHGAFTPYVSVLDLVANEGVEGKRRIVSGSVYWKEFLKNG